jgi:hypothetical protein
MSVSNYPSSGQPWRNAMQPHQSLRLQQQAATTPITTYGQAGFLLSVGRQFLCPVMMMLFDDDDDRGDSDGDNQKEKSSQLSRKKKKKRRRRRVAM